jgi:hypothetical protein
MKDSCQTRYVNTYIWTRIGANMSRDLLDKSMMDTATFAVAALLWGNALFEQRLRSRDVPAKSFYAALSSA